MSRDAMSKNRLTRGIGRTAVLAVAMTVLLAGTPFALAEEGSFRLLASYIRDYTTIDHAAGSVTAGNLTGTATVLQSSGEPFVEGSHSIVSCVVYVRTSQAGVDLESPCTITDGEGDSLYLHAKRSSGGIEAGGGGEGGFELLGGTGKYAGLAGVCPYETAYLPDDRTVTKTDCAWHRVAE